MEDTKDLKAHVGSIIKHLRIRLGLSKGKLASLAGLDRGYVGQLEKGTGSVITLATARKLADALQVDPEIFLKKGPGGNSERSLSSLVSEVQRRIKDIELVKLNVIGYVPAGDPLNVCQEDMGQIELPGIELQGETIEGLYALRIQGESLTADRIWDGDVVIVKPTSEIIDGKIYIVKLQNEVCLRHIYRRLNCLHLVSTNDKYQDIDVRDIEIQGRVILSGNWKKH